MDDDAHRVAHAVSLICSDFVIVARCRKTRRTNRVRRRLLLTRALVQLRFVACVECTTRMRIASEGAGGAYASGCRVRCIDARASFRRRKIDGVRLVDGPLPVGASIRARQSRRRAVFAHLRPAPLDESIAGEKDRQVNENSSELGKVGGSTRLSAWRNVPANEDRAEMGSLCRVLAARSMQRRDARSHG
jgi:hypothetical protein